MMCPNCRLANAGGASTCVGCQRVLQSDSATDTAARTRSRFASPEADLALRADAVALTQEEAWIATIGPSGTHDYVERFRRLSLGGSVSWHWPAFFATWFWLLYRKMWLGALIYPLVLATALIGLLWAVPHHLLEVVGGWLLGLLVIPAVMANRWYFQHCTTAIRNVRTRGGSKALMLERLQDAGGTNRVVVGVFIALWLAVVTAFGLPVYQNMTIAPRVAEALTAGYDVAAEVGRHHDQTGAMPSNDEVHRMAASVEHPSPYLRGLEIDPATGTLTLDVEPSSAIAGKIHLAPEAENGHLYWTCTTDDLQRYVPRTCRGQAGSGR